MKMALNIALILTVCCIVCSAGGASPLVKLPQGVLHGKFETSRNGAMYEAYLGIPYGVVPKRFGISEPFTSYYPDGMRDAVEYGAHCAQPSLADGNVVVGEEDCLFLNIYTKNATSDKLRPVLFYIHGGGCTYGTGAIFGAKYLMDQDVVLVTINYRLGILGFLNMDNEGASGNMGLKDQLLALKWVNENIHLFGGDNDKVTISGASAGGASTVYLMLSPEAKGLFHNAIPFSGVPVNPWAFAESTKANAQEVGKKVGCDENGDLVECLKNKPVQELLAAQETLKKWFMHSIDPFTPTIEVKSDFNPAPFMEISPATAIFTQKFSPVPVLITMNKDEGIVLFAGVVLGNENLRKDLDENFERVAPITFCYENDEILASTPQRLADATQQIREFYFGDAEITSAVTQNLADLYSDTLFGNGIHRTALALARKSTAYAGLFTHVSKTFSTNFIFGLKEILGIGHGDEASYIFNPAAENAPLPIIFQIETEEDIQFSKDITKIVTHFMEFSVPDPEIVPDWKPISPQETGRNSLNWFPLENGFKSKVLENPFEARLSFWNRLYNNRKNDVKEEL